MRIAYAEGMFDTTPHIYKAWGSHGAILRCIENSFTI